MRKEGEQGDNCSIKIINKVKTINNTINLLSHSQETEQSKSNNSMKNMSKRNKPSKGMGPRKLDTIVEKISLSSQKMKSAIHNSSNDTKRVQIDHVAEASNANIPKEQRSLPRPNTFSIVAAAAPRRLRETDSAHNDLIANQGSLPSDQKLSQRPKKAGG